MCEHCNKPGVFDSKDRKHALKAHYKNNMFSLSQCLKLRYLDTLKDYHLVFLPCSLVPSKPRDADSELLTTLFHTSLSCMNYTGNGWFGIIIYLYTIVMYSASGYRKLSAACSL